jgi:thiamine kinase-like enzyme
LQALRAAEGIGVGAEVVAFLLPEGHLVTRWIEGRYWTYDTYATAETLERIVATLNRVHALPLAPVQFSPFKRFAAQAVTVRGWGVALPSDFERCTAAARTIEAQCLPSLGQYSGFCHNDLYGVNLLDDGSVRIIDWEFAGTNDVTFDLATLVYAFDTAGPLPRDLQILMLERYFGAADEGLLRRLDYMQVMVQLLTGMWGLVQHGLCLEGRVAKIEGFDYLDYATYTFGQARPLLDGLDL